MTSKKKILVIGSSNTDMVVTLERFPAAGETVISEQFLMNPGGKGANQAVAAARLGGDVTFITKVGNDIFGKEARVNFERQGIDTSAVIVDEFHPSGVALIHVNAEGENSISVALGANGHLKEDAIMIPDLLKPKGYHSVIVGKWHLGYDTPNTPLDKGFDEFKGFLGDMMDDYYTHLRHGKNWMRLNETVVGPEGHATDIFTDWAIEYLDERKKDK